MKLNKYIVYWDAIEKDFTVVKINEGSELPKEIPIFTQDRKFVEKKYFNEDRDK